MTMMTENAAATSNNGGAPLAGATTTGNNINPNNNHSNNNNNNSMNTKTPPRNNYTSAHSPIASIKRPRSSIEAANGGAAQQRPTTTTSTTGSRAPASQTPLRSAASAAAAAEMATLSPLHPPKAVVRTTTLTAGGTSTSAGMGSPAQVAMLLHETAEEDELFSPGLKMDSHISHSININSNGIIGIGEEEDDDDDNGMLDDCLHNPTASSGSVLVDVDGCHVADADTSHHGREDIIEEDNLSHHSECSMSIHEPDHVDDDDFNPWQFIKSLPDYACVRHLTPAVTLPPKKKTNNNNGNDLITLVLDLDETLVHCTVEPTSQYDFSFGVLFHGVEYQVYVRLRPNLYKFLERIQDQYEVVVFTASQKVYADELLNRIDPENKFFHHRLFRESCLAVEGNFLKDLNVLGRDLSKTVLVDNSPHAFGYQLDNGIPIESWFDDSSDRELLKLERFLRQIAGSADVREDCRRKFGCRRRVEQAPDYNNNNMNGNTNNAVSSSSSSSGQEREQ